MGSLIPLSRISIDDLIYILDNTYKKENIGDIKRKANGALDSINETPKKYFEKKIILKTKHGVHCRVLINKENYRLISSCSQDIVTTRDADISGRYVCKNNSTSHGLSHSTEKSNGNNYPVKSNTQIQKGLWNAIQENIENIISSNE
ncbi:hypothetical protein HWI79_1509 [Cryptosporidium felis]|nr:hypothetical protein HWI79_1509 [Cryptosporidium felis]